MPAGARGNPVPGLSADDPDYLRHDLRGRLLEQPATFHFLVQFRTDPERMPLDEATVRWEETASPPVHVATLTLARQDIDAPGQAEYGENLAYNPWHALAEHAPVGSVADARKVVYRAAAKRRREFNGVAQGEPAEPRPPADDHDGRIVRAAIHPAIGIARVGNSPDEFFIGPEVDEPAPLDSYKDAAGALKRQAARFRVYGYNAAGEAVAELTADNADVRLDGPRRQHEGGLVRVPARPRHPGGARSAPAAFAAAQQGRRRRRARRSWPSTRARARSAGATRTGPSTASTTARSSDKPVYLGELRTDDGGRLLVLGGHGDSAAATRPAG